MKETTVVIGGGPARHEVALADYLDEAAEASAASESYAWIKSLRHVQVDGQPLTCVLWDLAGEDGPHDIRKSYLAGAAGFLLVADGTRRDTLTSALAIHEAVKRVSPPAVSVMALNKSDLAGEWDIGPNDESELSRSGWSVIRTSAKTGAGVEDAFQVLARAMLNGRR